MTGHSKSLAAFFEEDFLPDVLQDHEADTKEKYHKAVRKFVAWSGCNIPIHTVSDGILERFCRNIITDGISTKTARAYRVYLKKIVRHKYPDRCLKECGRRPNEKNPVVIAGLAVNDLDIEGSLYRFWRDWYVPKRMIGAKSTSIDVLKFNIVRFGKFLGRVPMVTDLTDDNVNDFLGWILNVAQLSVPSANSSRSSLLCMWRYAVKRRLLTTPPSDCDKIKELRRLPAAWTMEEMGRILEAARTQASPKTGMLYPPPLFFQALNLVAYDTGLRLRGLLGIELAGWKSERLEISVEAEYMKHKVAQTFRVSGQTRDAIATMLAAARSNEKPTLLFPWPVRQDGIFEAYRGIVTRAGLYGPKTGFHKLRRTAASHLTAALGIEAACRQLGHSSVEMTRRYVDPRMIGDHNAADHLPRPIPEHPKPKPSA